MDRFEKIYRFVKKAAIVCGVIFGILALEKLLSIILERFVGFSLHTYIWPSAIVAIYHALVISSFVLSIIFLLALLILFLVRVLHPKLEAEAPIRHDSIAHPFSPFHNLTHEEEQIIEDLFEGLPHHTNYEDRINLSIVSRYLTALCELGYISPRNSVDKPNIQQWVERVTKKKTPSQSEFNAAYPSTNTKEIEKAKGVIKKCLHKA